MSLSPQHRSVRVLVGSASAFIVALALVSACGRSSSKTPQTSSGPSSATSSSAKPSASAGPGDFGSLKAICGSGSAKGATARGVTNTDIHIGVTADPGAAAAPGLEQEFFDTADGFSKWCNAAGGINGRKIVVDKLDAKLFNVGQVMTQACQKDFMLVGNGNAFDSAGVKIREQCGLGQIPAYVTSPQAVDAATTGAGVADPVDRDERRWHAFAGCCLSGHEDRRRRGRQQHAVLDHPDRAEGAGVPEGHRREGRRAAGPAGAGRQLPALRRAVEASGAAGIYRSRPRIRRRSCRP